MKRIVNVNFRLNSMGYWVVEFTYDNGEIEIVGCGCTSIVNALNYAKELANEKIEENIKNNKK